MRRSGDESGDLPGQDSFLDIVANIVGILILLVMVVGVRAARAPAEPSPSQLNQTAATEESPQSIAEAAELRSSVDADIERLKSVYKENLFRDTERLQLATLVTAASAELERQRNELDDEKQRDFDLARNLDAAERRLVELTSQQVAAQAAAEDAPTEVGALPTPLAKTVTGEEIHLRLSGNRVAIIPFHQLRNAFEDHARRNVWRLDNRNAYVDTIGPYGGFRMRYRLEKVMRIARGPQGEAYRQITHVPTYIEFLPTSPDLGEPVGQALLAGSELLEYLSDYPARSTVVTVWTYPDSFDAFRTLKQTLFQLGYATAGRPKPFGEPIAASPHGTRSAAQ